MLLGIAPESSASSNRFLYTIEKASRSAKLGEPDLQKITEDHHAIKYYTSSGEVSAIFNRYSIEKTVTGIKETVLNRN